MRCRCLGMWMDVECEEQAASHRSDGLCDRCRVHRCVDLGVLRMVKAQMRGVRFLESLGETPETCRRERERARLMLRRRREWLEGAA